jgi:hypothetical protein
MKNIYYKALVINMRRINQCGLALAKVNDEYTNSYWQLQLAKAHHLQCKINRRAEKYSNIIKVDFKNKRKVA